MHPSIKESFGLFGFASAVSHYSPLVSKHVQANTSNINFILEKCQTDTLEDCNLDPIEKAINQFQLDTPGSGAYFNQAEHHKKDWQESFWGMENYKKLLGIKLKWDPDHLFYCHNCVGSEFFEEGGMCLRSHSVRIFNPGWTIFFFIVMIVMWI